MRDWAGVPPRAVRLDELTTTKRELALDQVLDEDSTFYGDLFPHAVQWHGEIYLEDGLHRALRAALHNRHTMHVRVLDLDAFGALGRTPARSEGRPAAAVCGHCQALARSRSSSRTTASASSRPRWVSTIRPSGRVAVDQPPRDQLAGDLARAPFAARRRTAGRRAAGRRA